MTELTIQTADGRCPAFELTPPAAASPWRAVLFCMDGIGIRPALFALGERLASAGYFVLMPDLFYRAGPYTAPDPKQLFSDPAVRQAWFTKISQVVNATLMIRDAASFLAHLAAEPRVQPGPVGVVGYCMGGRLALTIAGNHPDRIAACAAYHPGQLVTDGADSAHLAAPRIRARVYIGRASDDPSFDDQHLAVIEQALSGVDHVIETYPAKHGWVPSDTPVHDPAAAERHWQTLLALLAETL